MSQKNLYREFLVRYLARGAVGVSAGLAALSPSAAKQSDPSRGEQRSTSSFSERLETVRSAVSEQVKEPLEVAQILPRPFPNQAQPFKNFFGKAPFSDTFKNTFANQTKK